MKRLLFIVAKVLLVTTAQAANVDSYTQCRDHSPVAVCSMENSSEAEARADADLFIRGCVGALEQKGQVRDSQAFRDYMADCAATRIYIKTRWGI